MRSEKSDKCSVVDHKQHNKQTGYALEPLEERVLLSADLSGAVQALPSNSTQTPQVAVTLTITPASAGGQQALSVAELLAQPASAFPKAIATSAPETPTQNQSVSQTVAPPLENQTSMPTSDSSILPQAAVAEQSVSQVSISQPPANESTTPTNTTSTIGQQSFSVAQLLAEPIALIPAAGTPITSSAPVATSSPTNPDLNGSMTTNPGSVDVGVAPEAPSLSSSTTNVRPPIDPALLNQWQQQMTTYGQRHANDLSGLSGDAALDAVYYDAARVFYQIADYTHDSSWLAPAHQAATIYRDQFVMPNNGHVPGYWNFTGGLLLDYQHTGDIRSRDAVVLLSKNADFASSTPLEWTASTVQSREVAYTIMSYLNAQAVGQPPPTRLGDLVTQAIGHLDQWFVSKTAPYLQPFMAGLTMEALMQYNTAVGGDPRILPAIQSAVDVMWSNNWLPASQAFQYIDRDLAGVGSPTPAADLNMLIAPAYAWMYHQTGNQVYQQEADAIFKGGVQDTYLDGAKQFNQNYLFAFDFLNLRNG